MKLRRSATRQEASVTRVARCPTPAVANGVGSDNVGGKPLYRLGDAGAGTRRRMVGSDPHIRSSCHVSADPSLRFFSLNPSNPQSKSGDFFMRIEYRVPCITAPMVEF